MRLPGTLSKFDIYVGIFVGSITGYFIWAPYIIRKQPQQQTPIAEDKK